MKVDDLWQLGGRLARIVPWKGPRLRLVPGHFPRLTRRGTSRARFSLTPRKPTPRQPWRGAEQKRESLSGTRSGSAKPTPRQPWRGAEQKRESLSGTRGGPAKSTPRQPWRGAEQKRESLSESGKALQTPPRAARRGPENSLRPCSRGLRPPDPARRCSFGTARSCARSAYSRSNFLVAASRVGAVPQTSRRALGSASRPVRVVGHWPHAQAGLPDAASLSLLHTSRRADESRSPPAKGSRRRHRNRVGPLVS